MKNTAYYNMDGTLTRYALSCGYVESWSDGDARVELYREHGTYHVRAFSDCADPYRISWESFRSLGLARGQFKAVIRACTKGFAS